MDTISLILATYVITLVLVDSEGAWGLLYKFRNLAKVDNFGLLNCFVCTSFWVALIAVLLTAHYELFFIAWAGAVIIEKVAR